MSNWDMITQTSDGVWALHDKARPVGMAEVVVYRYKKTGNYVCNICRPHYFCHHINAVLKSISDEPRLILDNS